MPTAFPANPLGVKLELYLNSVWTDVSTYLYQRDNIQISGMGRTDWTNQIQPGQMALTLDNRTGRFTPKNSAGAYYPYITRNVQCRLSVSAQSGTAVAYTGYRFWGEVSEWPPAWDPTGHDVYCSITASGIWRRISQSAGSGGTSSNVNIGSPYKRYLQNLTGLDVPASAWMMEDGSNSAAFVTTVGAGANLTFTGTPSFSQDGTSFPGCDALPQMSGARVTGSVSSGATPTSNTVRMAVSVPAAGDSTAITFSGGGELLKFYTPSASAVKSVTVSVVANKIMIQGWSAASGGSQLFTGTIATAVNGVPVLLSVEMTTNAWACRIIKPGGGAVLDQVSGSYTNTPAAVTSVFISSQGRFANTTVGALSVHYDVPNLVNAAYAISGWAGETAIARFERITTEFGIPYEVIGTSSPNMGPQLDDTLVNVLQSIEDTDGGLLYEARDQFGLGYRALSSLQNQAVALTLNYTANQVSPPLTPAYDDQLLRNQVQVTNWDGYSIVATLTSGALSVAQPPNGVGLYADSKTINAQSDSQATTIATQRLFLGTVDDLRYPTVFIQMQRSELTSLFATIPGVRIGDYIQVTNMPAYAGGTGTLSQLAWGYTETLNNYQWEITFNLISEAPFATGFSPGVYTTAQVANAPSTGSSVNSVPGSALSPGAVGLSEIASGTLTARSIGGVTTYISATTPYDWSFAVYDTPTDGTYFMCTEAQAQPIAVGDTFTHSSGLGGPFTVTQTGAPSGGYVNIYFTPTATSAMTSGTVYGGKNGDQWINTSAGNQIESWSNGAWTAIQFGPSALSFNAGGIKVTFSVNASPPSSPNTGDLWFVTDQGNQLKQWNGSSWVLYQFGTSAIAAGTITASLIAANTITAGQIAAGTITATQIQSGTITATQIAANTITGGNIAAGTITASELVTNITVSGIVNATVVQASSYICTSSAGEFLAYSSSSPGSGTLINAIAGSAGTDGSGNSYPSGFFGQQLTLENQSSFPPAFSGASVFFSSVNGRPRYESSAGDNSVIDRSTVNVSQFTQGNSTTPAVISAACSYLANEGNQSSEFEIEISGNGVGSSSSPQSLTFQLYVDGVLWGAGFTVGATFWSQSGNGQPNFRYTARFRLAIVTTGAGGTAVGTSDGTFVNSGNFQVGTSSTTALGGMTTSGSFDSTSSHTIAPYVYWGNTASGQTITTYRTRITRRM